MIGDPNGFDWEDRCRECGRVDQSCKCDWPTPTKTSVGEDDQAATAIRNMDEGFKSVRAILKAYEKHFGGSDS